MVYTPVNTVYACSNLNDNMYAVRVERVFTTYVNYLIRFVVFDF